MYRCVPSCRAMCGEMICPTPRPVSSSPGQCHGHDSSRAAENGVGFNRYVVPPRILWWLVADLVTRWRAPSTSARADSTGGGPLQQCLSRSLSHFQHRARRASSAGHTALFFPTLHPCSFSLLSFFLSLLSALAMRSLSSSLLPS